MIEQDFKYFLECLIKATRKMDSHYFQLPVAQGDEPIYRERVYCYELYHQLRCILENNFPYKLHGEVDKVGHPVIRGFKKPDFIIHQPGDMEHNLVVIEVKPVTVRHRIRELREDFRTLRWFLDNANYYRGIMLIYGNINGDLPDNVKEEIRGNTSDERIVTIWHSKPRCKPQILLL